MERDSRERVAASRPELAGRPDGPFWSRRHLPALLRAGTSRSVLPFSLVYLLKTPSKIFAKYFDIVIRI